MGVCHNFESNLDEGTIGCNPILLKTIVNQSICFMNKKSVYLFKIIFFGTLYSITGILALKFQKFGGVTPVWPPSGIALGLMLLWGRKIWPGIILGIVLEAWYMGFNSLPIIMIIPGNILEPIAGAWLISRFRTENCFDSVSNALRFIRVAFITPLFSSVPAVIGFLIIGATTFSEAPNLWFTWWMGDLVGIFIFTPLITVWSVRPRYKITADNLFLAFFFLLINAFVFFYVPESLLNDRVTLTYLTVTLVIWISARYSYHGATLATFMVALFAMTASYLGTGPFTAQQVLMEVFLQVSFLTVTASSGLIIAAVIRENELINDQLKENDERLRSLINSTPDIICFKDGEGRWLEANKADLELFQLTGINYRGRKDSELAKYSPFYHDAFMACEDSDEIAWQKGRLSKGEEIIPRPNKQPKVYEVIKVPIFEEGRRKGLVVLGRDITERKIAEEKLSRYNERLILEVEQKTKEMEELNAKMMRQEKLATVGKISGSIAHELRNPLGAIKQSVFFLKRKWKDAPTKVIDHLTLIENELNTSEAVIRNLLEMTRLKPLQKERLDLREHINGSIAPLSVPSGIAINNKIPEKLVFNADPVQIKQVFTNIIQNAIQAIDDRGDVNISAEKTDRFIKIEIRDNGCGIPENKIAECFEPLYSTKAKGTGLGLAICKNIIDKHDGYIKLKSQEGTGTIVQIGLPV